MSEQQAGTTGSSTDNPVDVRGFADADALTDVLALRLAEERRQALRALLKTPLLTASHQVFPLVRRHADHLRQWLAEQAGWDLTVSTDHARLRKTSSGDVDHTRPATGSRNGRPFSRRRYVVWCLALAALERADTQTTLGWLADRILDLARDPGLLDEGIAFTMEGRAERGDLVEVVRTMLGLGVLARVAGDEEAYLAETGDALYDVDRRILASLLPGVRGPSTIEATSLDQRLAALVTEPLGDTPEATTRDARQRLTRRLLDDPVIYVRHLAAHEQDYLGLPGQPHGLARRVADATGLVPEMRAEGVAMLDPTGEATDLSMPAQGTQGHAALLLAEHLGGLRAAESDAWLSISEVQALVAGWAHEHPWSKTSRQEGAEVGIATTAIRHLEALGLVEVAVLVDGEAVRGLPAITRYAVDEPTLTGGPA